MRLTRRQAWLMVVAAGWTWYIWLARIWNIVSEPAHSVPFKAVHSALALVSVVLLTPIGVIGIRALRSGSDGSPARVSARGR
ncbi:MAG: hypothetical protein ACRDJO_04405 [Actinomycetota bacterium]